MNYLIIVFHWLIRKKKIMPIIWLSELFMGSGRIQLQFKSSSGFDKNWISWTIWTSSFDQGPNVATFWWAVGADFFQLVFSSIAWLVYPSKAWSISNFQHCFIFGNPAVWTQFWKFIWFSSRIALGFDQDISYYIMKIFKMVGNQIFRALNISYRVFGD